MADRQVTLRTVAAAAAALACAAPLSACGENYENGAGVYAATPTATASPASTGPPRNQSAVPSSPDLDQSGQAGAAPTEAQLIAAEDAARRFLAGYVPFTYGQAKASAITAGHPDLLAQLADRPPTVPPSQRRLRPKVTRLGVNGGQRGQITLLATVADGRQSYTIPITVTQQPGGRWLVSSVA